MLSVRYRVRLWKLPQLRGAVLRVDLLRHAVISSVVDTVLAIAPTSLCKKNAQTRFDTLVIHRLHQSSILLFGDPSGM